MSGPEPPSGWEWFDVEADVGVRAWGRDRAEAFAQAVLGVFALIVRPEEVEARETREVRTQGETPEDLLIGWVNECLYLHDLEGFVVRRVEVTTLRDDLVHGVLHGEELDLRRHHPGTVVKAATAHQVRIDDAPGRSEVRLIVDV